MRKIMAMSLCALIISGCTLAPGQYLNTKKATYSDSKEVHVAPPVIIPLRSVLVQSKKRYHNCVALNGDWLCTNSNHYDYHVAPTDILSIVVWDHSELTNPLGDYRSAADTGILVEADGTIFFPFAGTVKVSGMTINQIRQVLTARLSKYIRDPQVGVRVAAFNSQHIQIMGEVGVQVQPITNVPLNLLTALNNAGGILQGSSDAKYIYVIRGTAEHPKIFWLNANDPNTLLLAEHFYLKNADIVYVSTAAVVRWQRILANVLFPNVSVVSTAQSLGK